MFLMPLKLKYVADGGSPKWLTQTITGGTILTPYVTASKRPGRSNNSGTQQKQKQGLGHRRKSYGPW